MSQVCHSLPSRREDDARAISSRRRLQSLGYGLDASGLAKALRSPEVSVRAEAAFLLGYAADASAADVLQRAVKDDSARVRVEAALALARSGKPEEAKPLLRAELKGELFEDAPLRAARALALLGEPSGYGRVMEALASPFPSNRMEAIAVLPAFLPFAGETIGEHAIDPVGNLIRAASDSEAMLRRDALSAIALTDDPRAIPALQAALKDPDSSVRELAQSLLDNSAETERECE